MREGEKSFVISIILLSSEMRKFHRKIAAIRGELVDLVRQSSGKWKNSDLAFFVPSSRQNTEIEARLAHIRHGLPARFTATDPS